MSIINSIAFGLGVILHHGLFIHGEWHLKAPAILYSHVLASGLLAVYSYCGSGDYYTTLTTTCVVSAAYLCGLFTSISIYRLFFHQLNGFPGPRLAALSKLWHVWRCRDSRGHEVLEEWHKKYGPFVRTGPNEITMFHPAAYEAMDNYKHGNTRSDWYDLIYPRLSSIFTRDKDTHNARRRTWEQALGASSLTQYYPRLHALVQVLKGLVDEYATTAQPVLINDLMYWYAFDAMGDFGFGNDFGMLKNRSWVDGAVNMRSAITLLGPFSYAIWAIRLAFSLIPGVGKVRQWFQMIDFADACMKDRMEKESTKLDVSTWFIEEYKKSQPSQLNDNSLSGEAATMLVAGGDTTAPSLILLLYFLARYPEHATKIQDELENVDCSDVKELTALPHLTGTINESMRLLSAIPSFSSRITGPNGVSVDGDCFIPPNTKICAPRYSIGRLEAAYEDPHSFIPERWYSRPELVRDKRAFAPFGTGRWSCVGKNLAMAQLRLVAAGLLSEYDIQLDPRHSDGESFEREMLDQLTANPGKLFLIFKKREHGQAV
ncbi:benzoate 4-monooxygenase cytochrome P450 [Hypoxylon sp. FL1284]|nr:benzoate 4-monooxygenase cytochrome P450 [Hypoxylon sp. FL1284]